MDPINFLRDRRWLNSSPTMEIIPAPENKKNSLIKDTLELLEKGEEEILLRDEYKNVTLVLGNTGSGKSTFTQWIAGDNSKLISVEVKEGTGEYIIEDNNRISNSTVKSKTIFPELVIKNESNAAYYDCPGFSDTRSTSHDIATTYFIKKVLDFSERVKMIFVISHPSVRKGVDRQDFMKLLRHATDLIKNVDKFKNSIAIVATKVDNQYVKQGKNLVLVSDDKVIATIADFLQEVKQSLEQTMTDPNISAKEQQFYDNAIKFINAMLIKEGKSIAKIGIFRRPDEPGPLSEIALLTEGKTNVEIILNERLSFTENNKDFGYTVSQKSKNDINDLVEEINKKLWSDVGRIAEKIQDYYRNSVTKMQAIIKSLITSSTVVSVNLLEAESFSSTFTSGYNITSELVEELKNLTNPEELGRTVSHRISSLNIDVSQEDIRNITNQGKYISFLQVVSDKNLSTRPWEELFKSTLTYLSESRKNMQTDIREAAEKINSRIQFEFKSIANIMRVHYNGEMKSLDIQTLPDRLTREQSRLSKMSEEIKYLTTAGDLFKMLQDDNSNIRGIDIPKDKIINITILSKYFEFLQIVSDEVINISVTEWVSPFNDLKNYLSRSEKWYKFLNDLYTKFSEYKIQRDRHAYNVANLEDWGKTGKAQGIAITTSTFHAFLNKLKDYNLKEYDNVKDIEATEQQIEELNQVLTLTLKHKTKMQCTEPYVFIKGDYINVKEITNEMDKIDIDDSCKDRLTVLESGKFKFIHVFALKSIFIDRDVSYPRLKVPITFIAPKWEVVGTKKIDLRGTKGKSHSVSKARDGSYSKRNGENGAPGYPGGSGGAFFGIAERIVNGGNLTIVVDGGTGGSGQGGGSGYKGKDGISPSPPNELQCRSDYREIQGFKCQNLYYFFDRGGCFGMGATRECLPDRCHCKYKMFGTSGERGGDGGQGGRGGKGGYAGSIVIHELNYENPKIIKHINEGMTGNSGNGGKGGSGGRNGDDVIVEYRCSYYKAWNLVERINNNYGQSGKNGLGGANHQGIQNPERAISINEPAKVINQYKSYLRENLNDRFKKHSLNTFFDHLDNNINIKNTYDTLGLVDDLQHIDNQFHSLNQDMDFIPFYESLLKRVSEYAEHPNDAERSIQYKKTLGYLYTATLSRIFNLKDHSESNLIVDIKGFLEIVKRDIEALKNLQKARNKAEIIRKHNENYKSKVDTKIEEARSFIKNQILPEINKISGGIDKDIDSLVAETIELQRKAKEEKDELIKKKQELEKALAVRGLFSFFKVMGQVVTFLGPVGAAVGSVIDASTSVSESLVLDNQQGTKLPPGVVSDLKSLGEQIKVIRNRKFEDLNKLLEELSHETSDYPETLNDTSTRVENIKNKLNNLDRNIFDFKGIQALENELKEELERKEKELKDRKDSIDRKTEKALKVIEKFNQIVQLGSVLLDIFNNHKHNKEAIDALTDAIEQSEKKFQLLKQYEEEIYYTIAPLLQNMETNLRDVANNLDGKSLVSLDVSKWKVQSTLRDMKLQIQQFSKGFKVKESLARYIEKLEEVMTTLINIYDRMESYKEQQDLSDYIADISSETASSVNISDPKLVKAVNNLEIVIRSNLVLKQYKVVIDAFKQWVFPFASNYLRESQLPSHLQLNRNIEDLVSDAVKRIEDIKLKIDLYKVSVKKGDQYIHTGDFNSYYFSTKPFFVWKNERNRNIISKFLSGQKVVLKADVRDSERNKDAIKFRVVEFYLKSTNGTLQSQLDDTLKGFDVTAIHLGNSYYRYSDKMYLITSESQPIYRSYEMNNYGEPVRKNEVFIKIKEGDLMLSPFAAWEVKLVNSTNKITFNDLQFYKNKVDLELSGSGSYVYKSEFSLNKCRYRAIEAYGHSDLHNESKSNYFSSNLRQSIALGQVQESISLQAVDQGMSNYYMTNSAVSGMSSPVNYIFDLIKMYAMSNVISISRLFIGRENILETFNTENKIHEEFNSTVSADARIEHDFTIPSDVPAKEISERASMDNLETKNQVFEISSEKDPIREKKDFKDNRTRTVYNLNPSAIPIVGFDHFDNCTKPLLPNAQDVEHHIPLPQIPDVGYSLLLADYITRCITGVKYESITDESLLSPKQKLQKKINECIVQSELDIKRNFSMLISEMEGKKQKQKSWFRSLRKYVRSTFQYLGLVENEDIDSYAQDLRYLFNSMNE